jgi:hypothetical protein
VKKNKTPRFIYYGRPLSEEDIRIFAPSVMNDEGPSDKVTLKYSFFPTITLVRDLRTQGWIPYAVEQRSTYGHKGDYRKHFTKHMVVFRNPNIEEVENLVPEIILTNSHDGRNSFQFFAGLFHMVKQTSFIISEASFEDFRVKHQGYELAEVKAVVDKVVDIIPHIYDKVNLMMRTTLTPRQKLSFAFEAIRMRWKLVQKGDINLEEVIQPIREDEREDDLWNLFQIVQEKIVKGGIKYEIRKKNHKVRKQTARALVNIDQKIEVKKSLWKLASDLVISLKKNPTLKHEEPVN